MNERLRSRLSWILSIILVIGVVFSLISSSPIMIVGRYLVLVGFLLGIFYSIFIKGLSRIERWIVFLMSFILLIQSAFRLHHWEGIMYTHIALIIPMGIFIYISFTKNKKLKCEYPFVLVMAILALISFF